MTPFSAIVLCGGRSSRMGQPKAWLELAGVPLLLRTVQTLAPIADRVVVAAAPNQDLPLLPDDVLVTLDPSPNQGPLAAFTAALAHLETGPHAFFLTGCDAPFLSPAVVLSIVGRLGDASAAVPCVDGRWHPLLAAYRLDVCAVAGQLVSEGRRRMTDLLDAVEVVRIEAADLSIVDPELRSLRNVNTPGEFASALRDAQ